MPRTYDDLTIDDVDEALAYSSLTIRDDAVVAYLDRLLDLRLLLAR